LQKSKRIRPPWNWKAILQVNDLLAIIGNKGEDISGLIQKSGEAVIEKKTLKSDGGKAKVEVEDEVKDKEAVEVEKTVAGIDISQMNEAVLMPRLSDTMTEGVIAAWHKKVGDAVKKGEVLAEIETDKATMELESYKNGTLLYIGAKESEKIAVNELLCIIGEKGKTDVDAIVRASKVQGSKQPAADSAKAGDKVQGPGNLQQEKITGQATSGTGESAITNGRLKASPLAKKLAKEKGIDINKIQGSGDGGRIIKADVDSFKEGAERGVQAAPKQAAMPAFAPVKGEEGHTDISNSQIRNIIAKRLSESKFSAPHFYLTVEINMDNAISIRTQLNEVSPVKVSFNDMIVKAAALSLRQHPAVNASWLGDKIRRHHHIHIGIAVAIEDGLIVPVIRFADEKPLQQIAAESKELSGRARNKKLQPDEFTGNTFTISNLGMMDIDEFTAIINPPDSCIMAVGRIKETVVKKPDGFGVANIMKITMSCDHRSVDGATGAAFLQTFKKHLENPVLLIV
jgi:pyruvate dehydrogenase E2 component (dihydrolipoamide acetyltransferase)